MNTELIEHDPIDAPLAIPANWQDQLDVSLAVAERLAAEINMRKLFVEIGKGRHIRIEGWQLLGLMVGGVDPVEREVYQDDSGTWHATVELHYQGRLFASGSAILSPQIESRWAEAIPNAQRSMCLTRALGKAYRAKFGVLAELSGFSATPAEEMEAHLEHEQAKKAKPKPKRKPAKPPVVKHKIGAAQSPTAEQLAFAEKIKADAELLFGQANEDGLRALGQGLAVAEEVDGLITHVQRGELGRDIVRMLKTLRTVAETAVEG